MHREKSISHAIDANTPSVARMYDWLLGGVENYACDRAACAELLKVAPSSRMLARDNRDFLRRVVRVLAEEYGVRQFLDHGSGLPTQDNVHQVVQRIDRRSRVVYIDNDPIVLAHGRTTLEENDQTAIINADMRDTEAIFAHPEVGRLIDLTQPVAALFVSVLHCLSDDDATKLVKRVAGKLAPGSFLVVCQLVSDDAQVRHEVTELMVRATHGRWGRVRERREVEEYFAGMTVIPPGLTDVTYWRPAAQRPRRLHTKEWVEWGGVARL